MRTVSVATPGMQTKRGPGGFSRTVRHKQTRIAAF